MKSARYFLAIPLLFLIHLSFSQHYRTVTNATGNWNSNATWETSASNGPTWSPATAPPSSTSLTITIRNNATVTIPSGYPANADQFTVISGGTLTIASGGSLSIVDGTGVDMNNQGTVNNNGTVSVSGSFQNSGNTGGFTASNTTFLSGSRYIHGFTNSEGVVPLATWNTGSVMEVAGYNNNISGTSAGNWSQAFYDVEINLTSLTNSTRTVNFNGFLNNITHDFRVLSTGGATGGRIRLSQTNNSSINIGGNLSTSANTRLDITNGATGVVASVVGNVSISGTFTMSASASGISTLNVGGNLSVQTGGSITTAASATSATSGIGTINFNGSSTQFFTNSGSITNHIRYVIPASSVVDVGTSAMSGSGTFTLSGELRVGSTNTNGAIQLGTGAGSNLQNTGTRTFNSGSTIRFNGTALQYIGNGYPPPTATGVHLMIDNANGVSVASAVTSVEVTGNLTLNTGVLNISNKHLILDANIIQNSASSTITVNTSSDITVNGSGTLGTFPFAAGAQSFRNFTLNRASSGSVTFGNPVSLGGVVTLTDGRLIFDNQSLVLNGTFSAASGMLSSNTSSTLTIGGTGAFGTLVFDPSNHNLLSLTIDRVGSGTVGLSGALVVLSSLDLLNGDFTNGGGLSINNGLNLTRASTAQLLGARPALVSGSYNVSYQVNSLMTTGLELPVPDTPDLNNLTINGVSTVTLSQNLTINGDFTANSADMDGNIHTITMKGANWNLNGGAFTPNTSTVIFDGNVTVSGFIDPAFHHLELTASASLQLPAIDTFVSGDLNFASGSTFDPSTGAIALNGTGDQFFDGAGHAFYTVRVNNSGGVVNINSSLPLIHLLDIQSATVINTNNYLLLQSTGITTDLDASIGPVATGAVINGNVTVQRYMDPIGNTYRYLASPVTGALPPAIWGSTIYEYKYTSGTGSWSKHSTSSPLTLGAGYAVLKNMTTPITWSVTGPVSYGSFTWNFGAEGWYLIGNPFPSAIRWFDSPGVAWDLTNIATTIAVTDNSVSGYPNYFRYYSFNPGDPGWGSGELANGIVSTGQALWVYAGAGGGSLTVYEGAKENTLTGEFYRTRPSVESNLLKISLDNGKLADVAYLKLNPKATLGYEFRYDLKKLKNEEMNLSLKDHSDNELVISSFDKLEKRLQIPLEIEVKEQGTFTLSFSSLESFAYGNSLYLIDTYEGKSLPVSEGTYSFSINESTRSYKGRFYLSLDNALPERRLTDIIETYPNPVLDKLNVHIPDNERVTIHLTDSHGKEFLSHEVRGSFEIDMHDYPRGMYVVRILTEEGIVVRKVVR